MSHRDPPTLDYFCCVEIAAPFTLLLSLMLQSSVLYPLAAVAYQAGAASPAGQLILVAIARLFTCDPCDTEGKLWKLLQLGDLVNAHFSLLAAAAGRAAVDAAVSGKLLSLHLYCVSLMPENQCESLSAAVKQIGRVSHRQ